MINFDVQKQLNIILPNTNRALKEAIGSATPKELATLPKDTDLKSIMNSLLKQASQSSSSDKELLNLVKNNPTLKNLGSASSTIKELLQTIKSDKNPLPIEKQLKNFLVNIKDLSEPVLKQKIDNSGIFLESKLKNVQNPQLELKSTLQSLTKLLDKSGVYNVTVLSEKLTEILNTKPIVDASNKALLQATQENQKVLSELGKSIKDLTSKLLEHHNDPRNKNDVIASKDVANSLNKLSLLNTKEQLAHNNGLKEILNNDLKAILQQASAEITRSEHPKSSELLKQIDKLTLQIDYNQLVSHLSNATSLYLPFEWDQMKEGQISIHKDNENKFYVDIDLKLKEYGELNLKLTLYEENQLNIQIQSDNKEFKELIQANIPTLRSALIENQITPREIRLFDVKNKKKLSPYENTSRDINLGFEIKA